MQTIFATIYSNQYWYTTFSDLILDLHSNLQLIVKPQLYLVNNNLFNYVAYIYAYSNSIYSVILDNNLGYVIKSITKSVNSYKIYWIFFFLKKLLAINWFMFIIYTIFFITNFENYLKQQNSINNLVKLFILNASEKEIGPVDDYFFFVILFILTISLFICSATVLILTQTNILLWAIGGFLLLTILILTIPINLFIDFGIIFCTTIRGSASGNNFIKELVFDLISTLTVFIRFVIQNIRFFFIFSGIFELLEWVFSGNNSMFISNNIWNNNIFTLDILNNNFLYKTNFNYLIINTLLFIILYFYYTLHLLFLLLVQIIVYIGISAWLFFFLYSTKFLTKYEKFFIFKKLINVSNKFSISHYALYMYLNNLYN